MRPQAHRGRFLEICMIFAHMDIKQDAIAGIKSIALKYNKLPTRVLSTLALTQVGLLMAAGIVTGAESAFIMSSCDEDTMTLAIMITRVNSRSSSSQYISHSICINR